MNPNSDVAHMMISSERRDICIMTIARSDISSTKWSLSETASMLFIAIPVKPSRPASYSLSISNVVPARAHAPIGDLSSILLLQSSSLLISLSHIMAYAIRCCPKETGCACCM